MKKTFSKIVSMVLTVLLLLSMTSLTTFAAAEGFEGYTGELGTLYANSSNGVISGTANWKVNESNGYNTVAIVKDPCNENNLVANLKGLKRRSSPAITKGFMNDKAITGIDGGADVSLKFRVARENKNTKKLTFTIRDEVSSSRYFAFYFDLSNGQVTSDSDKMSPVPAGSTLYFADYVNQSVPENTWVDIEIFLIYRDNKEHTTNYAVIYANGKPLVYGADATDGTVSVSAGQNMLPFVAPTGSVWTSNGVDTIHFVANTADAWVSTATTADKPSFYIDDIDVYAWSEDERSCYLTMINYIAPIMDEYSAEIASSPIINTDWQLPTDSGYTATVKWSSETEGITVKNNKVILPNAEGVTEAVLKATVTRGDAKFEQSWTVKLAPRIKTSITATPDGGKLTSVTLNNRFALPENAKIVLGTYNDTTKLFNIFKMINAPTTVDAHTVNVDEITLNEGETVKAFVWNMNTLEPLAKID